MKKNDMHSKTFDKLEELISELKSLLRERVYIFRGHADAKFKLIPSVFRPENLKKAFDNFPITRKEIEKWTNNKRIFDTIGKSYVSSTELQKIFDWIIFLMQYNYSLYNFYEKFPGKTSYHDIELIKMFESPIHWTKEETFCGIFKSYYPLLLTFYNNGSIIQKASPPEELTGIDETCPQHYECQTATLDWTLNSYVALYFAIKEEEPEWNKDRGLYIAKSMPTEAKYFSIYAYKEIGAQGADASISIIDPCEHKKNIRAERQDGRFTLFKKPFDFYLRTGKLPSIEAINRSGNFELEKFNLLRSPTNLKLLGDILEKKGINESFLFPDMKK
jgi:hypothetical protein